jgi:hypothetical protein
MPVRATALPNEATGVGRGKLSEGCVIPAFDAQRATSQAIDD